MLLQVLDCCTILGKSRPTSETSAAVSPAWLFRRWRSVCRCPMRTLTQGEALEGGSCMAKFCSARRSGSQRMGRLYRAAARSTMSRSCMHTGRSQ